jgi:hypothetical protein
MKIFKLFFVAVLMVSSAAWSAEEERIAEGTLANLQNDLNLQLSRAQVGKPEADIIRACMYVAYQEYEEVLLDLLTRTVLDINQMAAGMKAHATYRATVQTDIHAIDEARANITEILKSEIRTLRSREEWLAPEPNRSQFTLQNYQRDNLVANFQQCRRHTLAKDLNKRLPEPDLSRITNTRYRGNYRASAAGGVEFSVEVVQ